jgi:hypothetical protein
MFGKVRFQCITKFAGFPISVLKNAVDNRTLFLLQGVYFADMMSKSANYCYASLSQNIGLLLLAEVAVAPFHDLVHANYSADAECKAKNKLCVTLPSAPSRFITQLL